VRSIAQPAGHAVDLLALSSGGLLVLFSRHDLSLHAVSPSPHPNPHPNPNPVPDTNPNPIPNPKPNQCSFNQRPLQPPLASAAAAERLAALAFSASGDVLLSAGERGEVVLRRAVDLRVLHRLTAGGGAPPAPLHCLALTADEQFVLAGSRTGQLLIWGVPAQAIARNLLDSLDRTLGLSF